MNFADMMRNAGNATYSENGGRVFNSTGNSLLDMYATIGGMRNRDEYDIVGKWYAARQDNETLADNMILYIRDCRGGLGERRIGRILLRNLAAVEPAKVVRNFDLIIENGRWDDLFCLIGTKVENEVYDFVQSQFRKDVKDLAKGRAVSLLGKWMPSINTSSQDTRALARKFCAHWKLSERTYRKTLSALRTKIDIVEKKMSEGKWNEIDFSHVPSKAMNRYVNVFNSRCGAEFLAYKQKLVAGETKVNAATLFPADIVKKYLNTHSLDTVDEEQWKAMPNYVNGEYDCVVVADVSGSMTCCNNEPMATSIGLATYFAQRNKGAYHGLYMTFTDHPSFITIRDGQKLTSIINDVKRKGVGYSTNVDAMMEAIYNMAVKTREVPKAVIIISDGEFDRYCTRGFADSIVAKWNQKLMRAGLPQTKIISWNVACRHDTVIAPATDNVAFCSGYSAGVFKNLLGMIEKSAYDAMVEVLTNEKYTWK